MTETIKGIFKEIINLKKRLKLFKNNHKNRKTFISLEEAEKIKRKVTPAIYKNHIQCRISLPACYSNKYVKVIVAKEKKR